MSENETGIFAYDLEPPLFADDPERPLLPLFRDRGSAVRPRYVPLPPPEGTVRVVLDSAGCTGEPADFRLYDDYPTLVEPYRVFDVPTGQYERWKAAREAFGVMGEDIEGLTDERARVMHAQVRERLR
jgi:hypothetical protein